jgi:hypothetical protein
VSFGQYISKTDWALTPITPGNKRPTFDFWNRPESALHEYKAAEQLQAAGLCHAYSGTCAIDIDNLAAAIPWLAERGIDLRKLLLDPRSVQIKSPRKNRGKLLYRLRTPLRSLQLVDYTNDQGKPAKALELRCATAAGLTMQDVLPPSPHPDGGHYEWFSPGDGHWSKLPDLPEELHQLWSALASTRTEIKTEPTVDKAQLLAHLPSLSADCDYFDWLKIGQGLHHEFSGSEEGFKAWLDWSSYGATFPGEDELRYKWESFTAGGGITGQTILQMQNVSADEFPIVPITQPEPVSNSPIKLWTWDELQQPHDAPPYLVDGLLERDAEASAIGPSQSYKSLWVLELGVRVATGTPFFGRETQQGLVVYLCGEGAGGMRHRLQALRKARELDHLTDVPFVVLPRPFALPTPEGVQLVRNYIAEAEKQLNAKLALLVIDTFGRYNGGDENVSEDLYKFFRAAGACRAGAALLVVHHTGHGDSTRGRGSSAWEQAVDTEFIFSIKPDTDTRVVENTKQKDGELASPMFFRLAQHETDSTRVGRPVNSVVLEPTVVEAATVKLGANEQVVFDTVARMSGGAVEDVVTEAIKLIPKPEGKDRRREHMRRALTSLVAKRSIEIRNEHVYKAGDVIADFTDLLGAS